MTHTQAYVSYSNTSGSRPRPAVIVVPDYDGIGNYERWRADLLASQGYVGALAVLSSLFICLTDPCSERPIPKASVY